MSASHPDMEEVVAEIDDLLAEIPGGSQIDAAQTLIPYFRGVLACLEGQESPPKASPPIVRQWRDGWNTVAEILAESGRPEGGEALDAWDAFMRHLRLFYEGLIAGLERQEPPPGRPAPWISGYQAGRHETLREVMVAAAAGATAIESDYLSS